MIKQSDIIIRKDIPYLGPDREEKLDVYLPSPAFPGPHPAVLLIHGGGWQICDKADKREINIATTLAASGYVVFSINYLLNIGSKGDDGKLHLSRLAWPQNFYDCKSALRFIRTESKQFNVDSDKLAVMGGSAGGHLAMLVGSTQEHEAFNQKGLYTDQSNKVSCIINFYGDYDIRGRAVSPFAGATPEETRTNESDASPITWIDANTAPMLIAHGTRDTIIPVERSRLLAKHLDKIGLDYWYVEIGGAPHTFHLHPEQINLEPTVLSFLEKHVGELAVKAQDEQTIG